MQKPTTRPDNPCFSSGPCAKRPGWSLTALDYAMDGRSHRSGPAKKDLKAVIDKHRALLGIPDDYRIGILPASDTGAMECALWSMLGARGVEVLAWEAFGGDWLKDVANHMKLENAKTVQTPYGELPDLSAVDFNNDVVFTWNGTAAGVRVPNGDWIAGDRKGLTICDATSAVFAYDMPWEKLDVTTWSWQKVLGGEAAHGMIVLSPRAVERLETYTPPWPLPKIFRLTKGDGKINEGIFKGSTINTPSMLAVADCLDALDWVERIGGLQETMRRARANFSALEEWVSRTDWLDFLAEDPETRSITSVCMKMSDPWFTALPKEEQKAFITEMAGLLEEENAGYDLAAYRDAPPGLRIWCGATVDVECVEAVIPWLEWGYETVKASFGEKKLKAG